MAAVRFSAAGEVLYAYLSGEVDHDAAQSLRIELDDALGLAAHEAGVVDDAGRTLYLAHQHEGSEKQADQDGCEKDGEKLDELLKFHKWCGSAAAHSSPHSSFLRTSWSEAHSQV